MQKKLILSLIISTIFTTAAFSFDRSTDFLKNNKSIRATALGDAVSAYPIDTDAIYYNPAGLSSEGLTYSNENHDYHNTIAKINHSQAFAFGKIGYSEERKYSEDTSLDIKSFGIGINGKSSTRWGMKYKDIAYTMDGISGHGYSIDFGVISMMSNKTTVGLLAKDIFKEKVPVPGSICLGFAFGGLMTDITLLTEMEYTRATDKTLYKLGAEYELTESLILRAGYHNSVYCLGGDFVLPFAKLQYAVTTGKSSDSETIHQIGLYFGK